jgi:outer membrane protein OmpA-like peptidoglycan-associated protein
MKTLRYALILALLVNALGCASMSRTQKGAAVGTASGAAVGAIVGHAAGNTLLGAIIGGAVGGTAGAYIGHYMDKQAEEMQRDLKGAKIERVGEGIKITFASGILFDTDKAELRPVAKDNLSELATILNKYPDTNILVEGHTDATGTEEHNLNLSVARAQATANYVTGLQVDPTRFTIMGYGESQPIADNSTVEGRQANRRVEIAIMANDKLKKVAKENQG